MFLSWQGIRASADGQHVALCPASVRTMLSAGRWMSHSPTNSAITAPERYATTMGLFSAACKTVIRQQRRLRGRQNMSQIPARHGTAWCVPH